MGSPAQVSVPSKSTFFPALPHSNPPVTWLPNRIPTSEPLGVPSHRNALQFSKWLLYFAQVSDQMSPYQGEMFSYYEIKSHFSPSHHFCYIASQCSFLAKHYFVFNSVTSLDVTSQIPFCLFTVRVNPLRVKTFCVSLLTDYNSVGYALGTQ